MAEEYLVSCDAGGTMTDVVVIDSAGRFVIGKHPTTPQDEGLGYWGSFADALSYWGMDLEKAKGEICSQIGMAVYGGTTMLNTLITRSGAKVGLLITRGFEDILRTGRCKQAYAGQPLSDTYRMVLRKHAEPLVPKKLIKGVTERIDLFGNVRIPLYEDDVSEGVTKLLDQGIEALVISFLQSYINPAHEKRAAEIARDVMKGMGKEIPIFTGSNLSPIAREVSRTNTAIVQAYAVEPVRKHLFRIEQKLKDNGYPANLHTVLGYGGKCDIRYERLYESLASGPVGGLFGAAYLGQVIGEQNIVCTDVGGTSFDVGVITQGIIPLEREPLVARMFVTMPMTDCRSIGAGTGTYIRLDPYTNSIKLGPDSAGSVPGPVSYDSGNETPTIGDCDLVVGILDPDYFLGGKVKLNVDKAYTALKERVADPLGLDVYDVAEGVIRMVDDSMHQHLWTLMVGRDPKDYVVFGYGGGGPMHLAGYVGDLPWKGIATVPYASAASALGCAAMDYKHRFHKTVSTFVPYQADEAAKMAAAQVLNYQWDELEETAAVELVKEGVPKEKITFTPVAYMRYNGQWIQDLETRSPVHRIRSGADMDKLIDEFQRVYTSVYSTAGRYPEAGFHVGEIAVIAVAPTIKPTLPKYDLAGKKPPAQARRGRRRVYSDGEWQEAEIYEMDELQPGNEVSGLAVIEAPSTTFFVPSDREVYIDEWKVFWLRRKTV